MKEVSLLSLHLPSIMKLFDVRAYRRAMFRNPKNSNRARVQKKMPSTANNLVGDSSNQESTTADSNETVLLVTLNSPKMGASPLLLHSCIGNALADALH